MSEVRDESRQNAEGGRRAGWVAAAGYLALVLCLWLPFSPRSGMPYETGFAYTSEISTWWNGFLHGADLLRMHTATFYQVAYLAGELTGFRGSWVPYQIVYAALWWARGWLVFLIARRLLAGHEIFWYLVGALALVHSSDGSLEWVGQLNQFGYIFWMLAALYLLVRAFQEGSAARVRLCLVGAALFEHMSLWSYESQFLIIVTAPLLLLFLYRRPWRRWLGIAAAWYAVPAIYVVVAAIRYTRSGGETYQESVLRHEWSMGSLASDWLFNISASLKFWNWAGTNPAAAPESQLAIPTVLAAAAFLAGLALLIRLRARATAPGSRLPTSRTLWAALGAGVLLVVLSFPGYLILESARSLWRTQMLSGLGAGLFFASVIGLCGSFLPGRRAKAAAVAALGSLVISYGTYSAVKKGAFHRQVWERHRAAMAELLGAAPQVKSGTLVILTNVPKDGASDAFNGDNTWFDMALRLAYPGTPVAGLYFHSDGSPAAGDNLIVHADGTWELPGNRLVPSGGAGAILAIRYDAGGHARIEESLPVFLGMAASGASGYHPAERIAGGRAALRAVRRYGPISAATL